MRKRSMPEAEKLPVSALTPAQEALAHVGATAHAQSLTVVASSPPGPAPLGSPLVSPEGDFALFKGAGSSPLGIRRASVSRSSSPTHANGPAPAASATAGASVSAAGRRRNSALRTGGESPPRSDGFVPHAVLTPNMTWKIPGSTTSLQDRPALRHEVIALVRKYDTVMAHAAKLTASAIAGDTTVAAGDIALDADFAACRNIITKVFTERVMPGGAAPVIPRGTTPDSPEIQAISAAAVASRKLATASGARRTAVSRYSEISVDPSMILQILDTPALRDSILELSLALYEHKWTDLTLAEAEDQISVSAHEHGLLLHQLREHQAHAIQTFMSAVLRLTLALQQSQATVKSMEAEVADARRARGDIERDIRVEYETHRRELEAQLKETKEQAAAQVTQAQEQVEKLSDSLKTLNAVFKKMRGDDDILKIADLKEAAARLERKLAERTRELEALQPVKAHLRRTENDLEQANRHIARLQTEIIDLRRELVKQMSITRGTIAAQADAAATSAVQAVRVDALAEHGTVDGAFAATRTTLSAHDLPPHSATGSRHLGSGIHGTSSTVALQPLASSGTTWSATAAETIRAGAVAAASSLMPGLEFLCARCNASLMAAVERQPAGPQMDPKAARMLLTQLAGTSGRPHVPCMYYRLLLPALPPLATEVIERLTSAAAAVEDEKTKRTAAPDAPAPTTAVGAKAALHDAAPVHPINEIDIAYPKRPTVWVRWCMRAILLAKQRDDSLVTSGRPDACAAAGRRQRMPEFVYAWFEHGTPPLDLASQAAATWSKETARGGRMGAAATAAEDLATARSGFANGPANAFKGGIGQYTGTAASSVARSVLAHGGVPALLPVPTPSVGPRFTTPTAGTSSSEAARTTGKNVREWGLSPADEARWAFYFGLRALAREDPEAKLFYALIDERHGEDEMAFFLYALSMLDAMLPLPLHWGPTAASCDYGDLPPVLADEDEVLRIKHRLQTAQAEAAARAAVQSANPPRRQSVGGGSASGPDIKLAADTPAGPVTIDLPPEHVWVPLSYALQAAARVLSRAPPDEQAATLHRIKTRSVASEGRLVGAGSYWQPAAPSALQFLRGVGGEDSVAAELYGTAYQARLTTSSADAILRKRRGLDGADARCIDLFVWLRILVLEYREEQARRRATIRMMFNIAITQMATSVTSPTAQAQDERRGGGTAVAPGGSTLLAGSASTGSLAATGTMRSTAIRSPQSSKLAGPATRLPALAGKALPDGDLSSATRALGTASGVRKADPRSPSHGDSTSDAMQSHLIGVSLRQFAVIVALISPSYPPADMAAMYRDAYAMGGGVVNYDSFMAAAEARQFFSTCLRLPPLSGCERTSHLLAEQSTQLAYVVYERWMLLQHDLRPWLSQLPPSWAHIVNTARDAVEREIHEALHPLSSLEAMLEASGPAHEGSVGGMHRGLSLAPTGTVNLQPDGRRMVVAYRRYLDMLLYLRTCNRADRGEAGGPLAVKMVDAEFSALEGVLRRDAQALAPDVLTLKRMARSGIALRLDIALQRPAQGFSSAARRGGQASRGPVPALATSIPLDSPADGEDLGPEEIAARLGVDTYAGDEIVQMRSHEAVNLVHSAARVACGVKVSRTLRRRFPVFLQRKRELQATLASSPDSKPPVTAGPTSSVAGSGAPHHLATGPRRV